MESSAMPRESIWISRLDDPTDTSKAWMPKIQVPLLWFSMVAVGRFRYNGAGIPWPWRRLRSILIPRKIYPEPSIYAIYDSSNHLHSSKSDPTLLGGVWGELLCRPVIPLTGTCYTALKGGRLRQCEILDFIRFNIPQIAKSINICIIYTSINIIC